MKKYLLIAALLIVGCSSTEINNADINSYRQTLVKDQENLAAIKSRMVNARDNNIVHSPEWWDAQIGLIDDTMTLNSSTIAGVQS